MNDKIKIMEVCGTHTHAIAKYGLKSILPENIKLISGPGCPVCVTTQKDIDAALWIASQDNVIFCSFGDMLRVPGSNGISLEKLRANGSNVKIITSPLDCLNIAKKNTDKKVVFMAVGFETTSPAVAATILRAQQANIKNFFIFSTHKLIIPAIELLLNDTELEIDAFLLPGHVSTIIGATPYKFIPDKYKKPGVITGFEAEDILEGINMILKQIKEKKFKIDIQYKRAVNFEGNRYAIDNLYKVFEKYDADWRGIGLIKNSGIKLKDKFKDFDVESLFKIPEINTIEPEGCICGEIIKGKKEPYQCKLFKKNCTPYNPLGPCMVSSEGTCAAFYSFTHNGVD